MEHDYDRRRLLAGVGVTASAFLLAGATAQTSEDKKEEVGAVEDLMREHGVIRRAILVYRNCAPKLRAGKSVDPLELRKTTMLLRNFGEDYHERKLEEAHIFPAVKKAGGVAAAYVDVLIAQHNRGREITAYVLDAVSKGRTETNSAESLARALEGFDLMYEHHAAREDTVIFPAWKMTMSEKQLAEMGEKFEEIEHQQFGKDGFDDAVSQITHVEMALGMSDISQFTPPAPSRT